MFKKSAITSFVLLGAFAIAGCESGGGNDTDDDIFVRTPETTTGNVDEDSAPTGDNVFDADGFPGDSENSRGTRDGMVDDDAFLHGGSGGVGGNDDTGGGTGGGHSIGGDRNKP